MTLPKRIDWSFVGRALFRVSVVASIAAMFYLKTIFASHADVEAATSPYKTLPPRVERLEETARSRDSALADLTTWRRSKDEIDTRLTVVIETQQRMIDRQQLMMDRQQSQIDELARRRP